MARLNIQHFVFLIISIQTYYQTSGDLNELNNSKVSYTKPKLQSPYVMIFCAKNTHQRAVCLSKVSIELIAKEKSLYLAN